MDEIMESGLTKKQEVETVFIMPFLVYVWPEINKLDFDGRKFATDFQKHYKANCRGEAENLEFLKYGEERIPNFYNILHAALKEKIKLSGYLTKLRIDRKRSQPEQ